MFHRVGRMERYNDENCLHVRVKLIRSEIGSMRQNRSQTGYRLRIQVRVGFKEVLESGLEPPRFLLGW